MYRDNDVIRAQRATGNRSRRTLLALLHMQHPSIDAYSSENNTVKFHPELIWNDGALGLKKRKISSDMRSVKTDYEVRTILQERQWGQWHNTHVRHSYVTHHNSQLPSTNLQPGQTTFTIGLPMHAAEHYWFASASLADPYCQSTWMCVCLSVCLSEFLRSNISETKGARGSVTMGSL